MFPRRALAYLRATLALICIALGGVAFALSDAQKAVLFSGGIKPVWTANFLSPVLVASQTLPAGLTYTKSGSIPATLFDSTGKLTYQGNNLLTYSNTFTNGAWSPNNIVTPILQNATDPFGNANSAWTLTDNNTNGEHRIYNLVDSAAPPTSYVKSIYAKAGTASYIAISYGLAPQYAVFNVSTGAVSSSVGVAASITSVGNGWYLCSITPTTLIGQQYVVINMGDSAAHAVPGTSYVGSGSTVQIYRASYSYVTYETAPRPADLALAPTTSAALFAPRLDTNPSTLAPAGLLVEEQRVQIAGYNRDLTNGVWTASNITPLKNMTGLDGVANSASRITAGANNGTILQAITLASSQRAQSAYLQRITGSGTVYMTTDGGTTWVDVTSQVGSPGTWARATIAAQTVTNPSFGFKLATSGDAIGVDIVQNEGGAFATSAIPNPTASTVTRTADVVQFNGVPLAALRKTPLTLAVEAQIPYPINNYAIVGSAGAGSPVDLLAVNNGLQTNALVYDSTVGNVSVSNGSANWSSIARAVMATSAAGSSVDISGGTVATTSTPLGTNRTSYNFGLMARDNGLNQLSGWVRSAAIYNQRLPDAKLKSLSVVGAPW